MNFGLAFVEPDAVKWGVVLGASLAAAVIDVPTRRIPNWLTMPLAASGLLFMAVWHGVSGAGDSLAGFFVMLLPYFILFALKGSGAGDAKMMGGLGAWLGLRAGLIVLAAVAIAGAILSVLRILVDRQRWRWLAETRTALYLLVMGLCSGRAGWKMLKVDPDQAETLKAQSLTVAYGPAIFVGVCIGAVVVHVWSI